jgi:hypothetical protein
VALHAPAILDGIDDAASRSLARGEAETGSYFTLRGVFAVPDAACRYTMSWGDGDEVYVLAVELVVAELIGLHTRLDPAIGAIASMTPSELEALWIDADIARHASAAHASVVIRDGSCTISTTIEGDDHQRMADVVALARALASSPQRRAAELVAALSSHPLRTQPARLTIDGDGVIALVGGVEVIIDVARAAAFDGDGLRTRVRAMRDDGGELTVVEALRSRSQRLRRPNLEPYETEWLAEGNVPGVVGEQLARIRPTGVFATGPAVTIQFAGFMVDARRLRGAIECIVHLALPQPTPPFR